MLQLLSSTYNHLTAQLRHITLYDHYQHTVNLLLSGTTAPGYDRDITSPSTPYTQEDLTLVLNLSRITVDRILGEWKRKGIIAVSYGKIMILERTSLETLSPAASPEHLTRWA